VTGGFDYSQIEASAAAQVHHAAARIREKVRRTLEDIIEVGKDLIRSKEFLPYGQFGRWLRAEFGWTERMARNFMSVAERFGRTEIISDLHIQPTAAYFLAAPSAPDEARQTAIQRATAGERITVDVAKEILAQYRRKSRPSAEVAHNGNLGDRLVKFLNFYQQRWEPGDLPEMARRLREYANQLERRTRMPS
jgi:hypothetical protein